MSCPTVVNQSANVSGSAGFGVQRSVLAAALSVEIILGVTGNALVIITKIKCWRQRVFLSPIPLVNLTVSDLGCSLLIIPASLLAVLSGGQGSPWCEVVSLLKFAFITSSLGSLAILSVQRCVGVASAGSWKTVAIVGGCITSWMTGIIFGSVPVVFQWIRYDPAEMLCAVFWEDNYSDMLLYILCAFSVTVFLPLLLILACTLLTSSGRGWICNSKNDGDDLSSVTPLLLVTYCLCYTPFTVAEMILLGNLDFSPAPEWLRTLSSVIAYLDCGLNPVIYCINAEFRGAVLSLLQVKRKTSTDPELMSVNQLET
ncbi:red-sensitive opsin isoform X2 [Lepisosteus oculatus]|uniref:red-sensitive opsin isoform X2 n=1 Tax=Lepisosteus oculatus TaxID=7918 RepID=UPI0037234F57